jgi:hypothetical protein
MPQIAADQTRQIELKQRFVVGEFLSSERTDDPRIPAELTLIESPPFTAR